MKNSLRLIPVFFLFLTSLQLALPKEKSRPTTHQVVIWNMKFQPHELQLNSGDSVKFINKDLVIHNVTEDNKAWASPTIAPEDTWVIKVEQDLNYYCSFHPMMRGRLLVKKE